MKISTVPLMTLLFGWNLACFGTSILDQSNTDHSSGEFLGGGTGNTAILQTFTAGISGQLSQLNLLLNANGASGSNALIVSVFDTQNGFPKNLLGAESLYNISGDYFAWYLMDFSSANIQLNANTVYALVFTHPTGGYVYVRGTVNNSYSGGVEYVQTTASSSWQLDTRSQDICFQTYMMPPPSPPTIICPEALTLECTNGSALGTLEAGVIDTNGLPLHVIWTVDGIAYQTNDIPSGGSITESNITFTANYGEGGHTVVVSASNGQAAPASCSTIVTVSDTLPPTILSISATPGLLWSPNHKMIPVNVAVSAVDNCDSSPAAKIKQVICNEPEGKFAPDWVITGPLSVDLRSERVGSQDRIYTIYVDVTDSSGNTTTTTTTVTVPESVGLH